MRAYERLLNYVKYDTTSYENAPESVCPSTESQKVFAGYLVNEMKSVGIADARMDEYGYVYGSIPSNCGSRQPVIGLISHMDTSSSASGANIHPHIVKNYDGGSIVLNAEKHIVMSPEEYGVLGDCKGMDLIVTDGTTLLGADDKAGIAEIMTAAETLQKQNIPHGKIVVAFTPDEEIGRGTDRFNIKNFGADFAYTVDGGDVRHYEYENFNAASAKLTVNGVCTHPGDGKNKMKNAILFGMEFNSMLPPAETPAHTEGRDGFYHLLHMEGCEEKAVLKYIIRDHSKEKFEARKAYMKRAADYLNAKYGSGTFELDIKDSYYNMKPVIEQHMEIISRVEKAMLKCGIKNLTPTPIRGGTDGAMLSLKGLPCPNLPTGGCNYHSRFEFIPVQAMDKVADILVALAKEQQ